MAPGRRLISHIRERMRVYVALNFFATIFGTSRAGITQVLQKRGATHATFGFMSILGRDKTFSQPINWTTSFFMFAFHIGAVAALFFFTWKALALAVVLWWIAGSLGIGMSYHRLLTHRGYKTPKWMEYFLTVCGTLALEGGPIAWVATHRVHHQNTDKEGDPHSPQDGGLWAHMGWIMTGQAMHNSVNGTEGLCSRSPKRQVSCLDHQVALGAAYCARHCAFCNRSAGPFYCGEYSCEPCLAYTQHGW